MAVDDLDLAGEPLVGDDPRRLPRALTGAREAAGDVHGDDVAAGFGERLEAGEEVAHGRLGGRGEVGRVAQPRVEGVEVVVGLGQPLVAPADVEAHLLNPPALDQAGGQVGGAVGDDSDAGHGRDRGGQLAIDLEQVRRDQALARQRPTDGKLASVSGSRVRSAFSGRTAWARSLQAPLREFLTTETGSAVVLLAAAVAALAWANIDLSSYESVWRTKLSIQIGGSGISQDLRQWVNSGLMTFFFFVVGLEVRREFDVGELRERRRLTLPVLAGLGGMAVPVAIYLAFNGGGHAASGWGVAMSTDTAFALGMLALVGPSFPDRLRGFMLTIIVVDDVVALLVIAVAYSHDVALGPLLIAVGVFGLAAIAVALRIRQNLLYLLLAHDLLGGAVRVGRRPRRPGPGDRPDRRRLPGGARRAGAGDEPLPQLPRAADAGAGPLRPGRAARGRLAERPPAAALPPVDQLRDRAALRPRQRRHRDRRRLPLAGLLLADHAGDHLRLRARQAGRRDRGLGAGDVAEPGPAAPAGRLGGDRRRRRDRRDRLHRLAC